MTTAPSHPDPLAVTPPALDLATAQRLAADRFGVEGTASPLGGERDQNLRLDSADAAFVLKVSNPADGPTVLDLQTEALRHLERQDPELPMMRTIPTVDGEPWTRFASQDGTTHLVRMFTLMPGRTASAEELDHRALHDLGRTVARVAHALRGFFHPAARYDILWDLRHTPRLRALLDAVPDRDRRVLAARILDRFDARVAAPFDGLRAQVVHNDLTLDNVLVGDDHRVTGIVDVGDLTHTALVCDLAITLAGVMWRRSDPIDAAQATIAGYAAVVPIEDPEAHLLADLVAARLAAWGVIAAWRADRYPTNAAYIASGEDDAWDLLATIEVLGPDAVGRRLAAAALAGRVPIDPLPTGELLRRRRAVLGRSPLSYDEPVHLVAGAGVWLQDALGHRYLDAYNNVPVVGHAHPVVAAAVADQVRTLATNSRYLNETAVALAERLVATMPDGLDTVLFVNSGSEANDLAWRIATAATGRTGAIVTDHAYHGITEATTALSPEVWPEREPPRHVARIAPPGARSVGDGCTRSVAEAVTVLHAAGHGIAALFADPMMTSDGIQVPTTDELRTIAAEVRRAGGLVVADEVQAGHGRCGSQLWSFAATGLEPDAVTLGKPMGNGHPVAALVTRSELADALMARSEVFSTFGGNPVSCAAALAVLDVLAGEDLPARADAVGRELRDGLEVLVGHHELVAEVRGRGLLLGVELRDPGTAAPAAAAARAVMEGLRRRRVLVGVTGRHSNVLKIRPPLVFDLMHADLLLEELDGVLGEVEVASR
jgi:4-aminobutyrate aminotransferase-like enzyme/Ser/Thr protein kinase RdoA (MazF antagonist)